MDPAETQAYLQHQLCAGQKRNVDQEELMRFDPANGRPNPYPSHARQYRDFHGQVAWLYCPWTGTPRHALDVGSDVFGRLIRPHGAQISAAEAVGSLLNGRAVGGER